MEFHFFLLCVLYDLWVEILRLEEFLGEAELRNNASQNTDMVMV